MKFPYRIYTLVNEHGNAIYKVKTRHWGMWFYLNRYSTNGKEVAVFTTYEEALNAIRQDSDKRRGSHGKIQSVIEIYA